jgi:membrane protein implicated in regulation of membrane protease activity
MSRRLQWGLPETPRPKHPYRDTLILYGVLAILIVVVAWATGGAVGKAAVIAGFFFVVASVWSVYRWRSRLRAEAKEQRIKEAEL